jgi:PucR-like helix-turn-helix protein/purine catabolism regulatory family protein/diguanylate cyclase with GGDEF domain
MLLRDLLAIPELHLKLLHEPPGGLDRVLRRVCASDLLHPMRYVSPDDLVVSGLVWRRSPEDSEIFVAELVGAGAAALAAGDALLGSIPDDLVESCQRHELPLVEVPTEVSFADVIEYLVSAVSAERGAQLSASLGRQRQLLADAAAGRSLAEIAARVSRDIGYECRVLTPTGRHVVPGPAALDPDDRDRLTKTFLTASRFPVVAAAPGKAPRSLFTVGTGLDSRLTSWMVAVDGDVADWPPDAVEAVTEFASVAALDRFRSAEAARGIRHIAEEAIGLAESGGSQLEIGARLRQAELNPHEPVIVVVADFAARPDMLETMRTILDDIAALFGPPVAATGRDGRAVALLPGTSEDVPRAVRAALARLAPGVGRTPIAAGISASSAPGALAGALEEARYLRRLAELRGGPVSVVSGEEVTSYVLLLATVPDEVRRTFAARVLGPVLAYDERTGAGLRETLEAFLACSGSWSRASEVLHLHINTVRYRIERIEQLTGRNLADLEDRVDVFLALRSL